MIQLLENELFGKGYVGQVIIGAGKFSSLPYIAKISETTSIYKDKIHFTIDEEDMLSTKKTLDRLSNKNVVYNFGVTHCSPKKAASTKFSKLAAINKVKGKRSGEISLFSRFSGENYIIIVFRMLFPILKQ